MQEPPEHWNGGKHEQCPRLPFDHQKNCMMGLLLFFKRENRPPTWLPHRPSGTVDNEPELVSAVQYPVSAVLENAPMASAVWRGPKKEKKVSICDRLETAHLLVVLCSLIQLKWVCVTVHLMQDNVFVL